ncbi:E3 ubiquitin-protein ligase [Phytophthora nicotianae]|uniref:E3 ubiquitin-protein ligase n=1 Tax=Phytophthora nicotianae TaxID=4792 RepID=A0A0W8DBZ7_PHYNI|nr:E3 ubiquitin-protein ligase [Phytophthora nicotianae]
MAWKTPCSKLSTSNGNHERHVPTKPQKLPTMKRGSSLRVGRVVSLQVDSDAQHTAALEQRRLREKAQAQVRLDNKAHQQIVDELRREREQSVNDRFALENKLQTILQDQQTQSTLVEELESRCAQLEDGLEHSVESCQQLREVRALRADEVHFSISIMLFLQVLVHEEQKRKDVAAMWKKLEEEKLALEEKHRALIKTLKGANSRTAGMEKKRSELCQVENQLREQLAALTKENSELKARRGQMSSQTKHLQARIAALESVNFVQEKKLEDAVTELESARRYCRDFQFRTKQLQEEVMFLKNRKSAAIDNPATSDVQIAAPETDANDMPCWMKD